MEGTAGGLVIGGLLGAIGKKGAPALVNRIDRSITKAGIAAQRAGVAPKSAGNLTGAAARAVIAIILARKRGQDTSKLEEEARAAGATDEHMNRTK